MLWAAFAAIAVLITVGLVLTLVVLQTEKREEYRIVQGSLPMLEAVHEMDSALRTAVSSSRGYLLSQQTQFLQQYDEAILDFERASSTAMQLAIDPRDVQLIGDFRRHFVEVKGVLDQQIVLVKEGKQHNALEYMIEGSRMRRASPAFAREITENQRRMQLRDLDRMDTLRQWIMLLMVLVSLGLIAGGAIAVWRVERRLVATIDRQSRRTETMIAGMPDGVMLVNHEGRTEFINPAGQKLLGSSELGVAVPSHAETYRLRNAQGDPLPAEKLPAAQAFATGRPVHDKTLTIVRDDRSIVISMNAVPIREEGRTSGVVVTFRDITERRRLEEEMQRQAERAQILADAGAFFSSNIDPVWVTQAIAERVAEVLGDWAAVVLKSPDSNELKVASIYHRDMTSLGLAWSYIYRQPLTVGEGIIGQVISTGFPSLTTNIVSAAAGVSDEQNRTSYHTPHMQLASLLILPLRTRREMLGALVIAANDPERAMDDDRLPLAEVLAERAALAVENAKLYTEQVEARRKVEDLSRLKDEFLSIASHELRTPVTSIKGYTQLARTLIRENDLETSEEYLAIALDQIDRMSRLILELLDVSRIETGRLEIRREPITWSSFVRDVVQRHHTAVSDRRFHATLPENLPPVYGDRDRLEQVLGNLLENAVKYSPDGSEIFVQVEDRGDHLITSVRDRGIGIPADELGQVFERFHRGRQVSSTNYGGLGLGLYITKQIVERHGGSIWVESKEGQGTTFFFSLPVERVAESASRETEAVGRT